MATNPADVVRRFMRDIVNGANPSAADDLLTGDFRVVGLAPGVPADRSGLEMVGGMMREAFPDWSNTEDGLRVDGDWVHVGFTGKGTHCGAFMGVAPTGRSVSVPGRAAYRVVDGRIAEDRLDMDVGALMQQLTASQPGAIQD